MTNFRFFIEQCKNTKHFFCQIVMKDNSYIIIDNDLPELCSVSENEILVFIGAWHKLFDGCDYLFITSKSKLKNEPTHGLFAENMGLSDTFSVFVFEIRMFYMMLECEVAPDIVDLMDSHLYKCYPKQGYHPLSYEPKRYIAKAEQLQIEKYNDFWKNLIERLSKMSAADRMLYARVHGEIYNNIGDLNSSDVHAWDDVVFDVIQMVRNGSNADEVEQFLEPYGWHYGDAYKNAEFAKKRNTLAHKVIAMIGAIDA